MIVKAFAKINLSLDVVGKRQDGYHLLRTVMQKIELYDLLDIKKTQKGINLKCSKFYLPTNSKNLAYKAADIFLKTYNISSGVNINIKKFIPVSAGLAGGSTDAAAVLMTLRDLYKPDVSDDELVKTALKIGADVPYCMIGRTALCEGIGEKVTELKSFRNNIVVLVKPSFGVSTKEVYRDLDMDKVRKHPDINLIVKCIENQDLRGLSKNMGNVLENVTLNKHSTLKTIKHQMIKSGAIGSLMSGSGPTIFGFFDDMFKAQVCYDKMKMNYKGTFITRTI